jgi:hypothetical protein
MLIELYYVNIDRIGIVSSELIKVMISRRKVGRRAIGESSWVWCFAWLLLVGREAGSAVLVSPPLVLGTRLVLRLRGAHTHTI